MKNQGKGGPAGTPLPLPVGGGVRLCHDYQRVAFKMHPGNGHATQDGSHSGREQLAASAPDLGLDHDVKEGAPRKSSWMVDSSSQAESTDPRETLTESSTLTFVDAHSTEESGSLRGVGTLYLKECVLIDDDDDGDMSLREKTVTDVSAMGGGAADLVCRRLFSSSSCSVSDGKAESPAPDGPCPGETPTIPDKTRCCLCSVL